MKNKLLVLICVLVIIAVIYAVSVFLMMRREREPAPPAQAEILGIKLKPYGNGMRPYLEVETRGNRMVSIRLSKCGEQISENYLRLDIFENISQNLYMTTQDYETPEGGTYTVGLYHNGDRVDEETISFSGANLEVITARLYQDSENFWFQIFNQGDLPVWIYEVYLEIIGENGDYYQMGGKFIGPHETSLIKIHLGFFSVKEYVILKLLDSTGKILHMDILHYDVY